MSADGTGWPTTAAVTFGENVTIANTKDLLAATAAGSDVGSAAAGFGVGYFDTSLETPLYGVATGNVTFTGATDADPTQKLAFDLTGITTATTRTITWPDSNVTIPASFASAALDNLASVAVNTSITSDTTNTDDLGTAAIAWKAGYVNTVASGTGVNFAASATAPAATDGGAAQAGQSSSLTASAAVADVSTAGAAAGGSVTITAGAAARNTSGNADGGDINLVTGAGIGTGTAGKVLVAAGSSTVPSLTNTSDTDTGIAFGANTVYFVGNGANIGSISSAVFDCNVGITGPGTAVLQGFTRRIHTRTGSVGEASINSQAIEINTGATGMVTITLPTAAAGIEFTAVVTDADGIGFDANTGDEIRIEDQTSAAGTDVSSTTIGDVLHLVAINASTWQAISWHGTWTNGAWTIDNTGTVT